MHGTREHVLEIVVRKREVRVEELAEELGITTAAVRRHLDNLRADGLIEVRAVRQATGRPYYAFHPTERAIEQSAPAYADLLERMLLGLDGRSDILGPMIASVAEALASRHRDQLSPGTTPEERVEELTELLKGEGILDSWHQDADGIHLVNCTCPYRKAAAVSSLPCDADRRAIELLLGLDVEQLNRIVDGSPVCEYLVRPQPQLIEVLE